MYIGEGPWGEDTPQLGSDGYVRKARAHLERFIDQIRRHYGSEPEGGRFRIESNAHDFGTYYTVEYVWDDRFGEADAYGYAVEGDELKVLEYWDKEEVDA